MSTTVNAWDYAGECVFATGVDSAEALIQAAHEEDLLVDEHSTLVDVRAYIIPAAMLHREEWDGTRMWPCALDAAPGRGYVRVLRGDYANAAESSSSDGGDR